MGNLVKAPSANTNGSKTGFQLLESNDILQKFIMTSTKLIANWHINLSKFNFFPREGPLEFYVMCVSLA